MKQSSIDHIKRMQRAHDILIRVSGVMEELTMLTYQVGFDDDCVIENFYGDIDKLKEELVKLTKVTYQSETK